MVNILPLRPLFHYCRSAFSLLHFEGAGRSFFFSGDLFGMLASEDTASRRQQTKQASQFRSVLPHEPPLVDDPSEKGYLHIQGAFTPKVQEKNKESEKADENQEISVASAEFWAREKAALERILLAHFAAVSSTATASNSTPVPLAVQILDPIPPYTKVRLVFDSSTAAHLNMLLYRRLKLTPAQLYHANADTNNNGSPNGGNGGDLRSLLLGDGLSHRVFQITQITTHPLPEPSWTRSNPPKFRRLIARPGEDSTALEEERQSTRFVVLNNLLDPNSSCPNWEEHPHSIAQAIRSVVAKYDQSSDGGGDGLGVEVFVPTQTSKRARYCHVGMRSAADARAVVLGLQEQVVQWPWSGPLESDGADNITTTSTTTLVQSGKLFVDYAAITQRSAASAALRDAGGKDENERGEPTRPQCTSTTDHVDIPGLVLVHDFVSEEEEAVLMAVLTGPQAPWAPSQSTASYESAAVRRKVQHYGYVFDYQTADVLRDRSQKGAECPPLPAISNDLKDALSRREQESNDCDLLLEYEGGCTKEGRGWEALAGLIERTRRYKFRGKGAAEECATTCDFPDVNQLTVNHYLPGEGIGSHVDTPSAFDDGLISLSLNSGIVMEFRRVGAAAEQENESKKLVYLPPRSLLLMSKDARYEWEHMIVSRMTDTHNGEVLARKLRLSLTFRTARSADGAAHMPLIESTTFPPVWGNSTPTSGLATPDCERDHVHAVYDAIATQWHHTRGKRGVLWPGATHFLQKLPAGSVVADVGCGDGKYFPAIWEAGSYVLGTDISEPLLRTAIHDKKSEEDEIVPENRRVSGHRHHLRNRPAVAVADCMSIPFRTSSCDAAICIAVLHHLSTRERRKRCIEELVRIVRPGGVVNVQAWAIDQEEGSRRKFAANDVFVPFNAQPKYLQVNSRKKISTEENETPNGATEDAGKSTAQVYSEAFNAEFDDSKGLVVFKRYCHLYRQGELDDIALEVPGVHILESGFESGNYFIIFEVRKSGDALYE